jgi:putative aminopeptidase FrvX
VRPGSPATPIRSTRGPLVFGDPADPLVAAWTFDDRMGVVALLRLLQQLAESGQAGRSAQLALPTVVAFTTREEVGGYGAKYLAQHLRPAIFVAVDGSPITPDSGLTIDGRPATWAHDRLGPYSPKLVKALLGAGRAVGVEVQTAAYGVSASDASMANETGAVGQVACFGHVRESSHGYEVARLAVFDNLLRVLHYALTTDGLLG